MQTKLLVGKLERLVKQQQNLHLALDKVLAMSKTLEQLSIAYREEMKDV